MDESTTESTRTELKRCQGWAGLFRSFVHSCSHVCVSLLNATLIPRLVEPPKLFFSFFLSHSLLTLFKIY